MPRNILQDIRPFLCAAVEAGKSMLPFRVRGSPEKKVDTRVTRESVDRELRRRKLQHLTELVNGYDFADVIAAYCRGFEKGNEQLKSDAIRWLRGEFSTKTDARQALGVRAIVDDASVYDQLKLMARFVRLAGFAGLMINFDELVNLYKLRHHSHRVRCTGLGE